MKRRIILHGYLKKLVPQQIELAVSTVAEAIEALCVVTGKALHPTATSGRHRISVVGFPSIDAMHSPLGDDVEEIHLVPAFAGGGGGVMQIIVGVVIIIASIVYGIYSEDWGDAAKGIVLGASMILGGILAALTQPKSPTTTNSNPDTTPYLGAPQNTTAIGTPIPIGYGRFRVYGQIVSADIEAVDTSLTYTTVPTAPTGTAVSYHAYGTNQA